MPTYNTGNINQKMRVTGAGFYALSGLQLPNAGFVDFSYYDASPEYIEFTVPENITLGPVNFYFITGQTVSDPMFVSGVSFYPVPRLDSVSPTTQEAGDFVTISGKSLLGVETVYFNNILGTDVSYNSTSGVLLAKVPYGYTTGPIRVNGFNNTGIVSVLSDFNFYGSIFISGFSSNTPYEGDLFKISGRNFNLSFVSENYFPVNFTTSVDNGITGFVTARFTGSNNVITGIVPQNANAGFVTINSIDNTSFTSKSQVTVLKSPFVASSLNYYLASGESNTAIGKNFNYVTGIVLSGINYREPKSVLNSGVASSSTALFKRSLLFSGDSYLKVDSKLNGDFHFGAAPFTIEFLINPISYPSSRIDLFQDLGLDGNGFSFYKAAGASDWTFYATSAAKATIPTSNVPANTWTKVVISRTSSNGSTYIAAKDGVGEYSNTVSAGSPYTVTAGSGLFVGTNSLGANGFLGRLEDFRIVKGVGLYDNIDSVIRNSGLFDTQNTVLFLQGDFSDTDYRVNRINSSVISNISGYVEDSNYGGFNKQYSISDFGKNSTNTTLTFTGTNVPPGVYDITIKNSGGRDFLFENFEIIKGNPVIKNINSFENYIGGPLEIIGHNIYPDSQFLFQDTGDENSNVEALESANSYSYQSTFRKSKPLTIGSSAKIDNSTSRFDGRSFSFADPLNSYVKFSITGAYPNVPLSYGKSFAFELDFKPGSSFSASDTKYLVGTQSGLNVFVTSDKVVISGIDWDGFSPVFSGKILTNQWNHLSISKSYNNLNSISGKILLNGSGLNLFSDLYQLDFSSSNLDFSLNSDKSLSSPVFDVYIGRDYPNNSSNYWNGYIDEIRVVKEDPYQFLNFAPLRRARNNINTEILIHANVGLIDDNTRDFGYLKLNTPNLSSIRKTNVVLDNTYSRITGGFDKRFTFLKTPSITGIEPALLFQGDPVTGYGTDLYYIKSISIGGNEVTGYSVSGLNSEFKQRIVFNLPDLAQSGDFLTINSNYYSYTYPSGLAIGSGLLSVDGFTPLTGLAGTLITLSGKFLNTVSSLELGRRDGAYKVVTAFASQSITGLSFYVPQVYDITDGPITLNGSRRVTTTESLTFLNPIINKIIPNSAYFGNEILLSGNNLSGFDFYGIGFNNEPVKYSGVSIIDSTGALVIVPREVKRASFRFFNSGTTDEVKGFSPFFNPSTTITGVNSETFRSKDSIVITGVNAHRSQSRDLYISGYNVLTNKTGQYLITQNMSVIDVSTLSGTGVRNPYTGYSILSGKLNISSTDNYQIQDLDLLISGTDAIGFGYNFVNPGNEITLDGYIGSGKIFFQRNSFDPDEMFNNITIKAPLIKSSGLNITTGTYRSLITLTGENLNYVTGIRFIGVGELVVGASGGVTAPVSLQVGYKTGININIDARELSSSVVYKDFSKLQFYPPSVAGKNVHRKDVEDVRPVTGMFYLQTYLNEIYGVSGRFNYAPFISLKDGYLNNRLTYRADGTSQISGYDGSIISFVGEGIKNLTGVDFFSESNGRIIETFSTNFQTDKKKFDILFLNEAGGPITGYRILDAGKGYTTLTSSITMASYGGQTPEATAYISRIPPYVGTVTGVTLTTNVSSSPSKNYWSGSNLTILNPASGFFMRNPNVLLFSGNDYATQSEDGSKYYAYYTASTTYPLQNDFVVGEKLNVRLSNYVTSYSTTDFPFLVIQNPNNFARITDIPLTGSYVDEKAFRLNYYTFYANDDSDFNLLDAQIKASILYPTGYQSKRVMLTAFKPSKNRRFIDVEFSSKIPATGDYVIAADPEDSKYLKLRIEAINTEASQFKGLGNISSKDSSFAGSVSAGSNTPGMGI